MLKINYKKNLVYIMILLVIFFIDRVSKLYILDLANINSVIDIYLTNFLNIYLIWNKGIAFGLLSYDQENIYNFISLIIILINILIIIVIKNTEDYRVFFYLMILGGSMGNLYDRIYYNAVPDFIDFHIGNFHWFVFNIADMFISLGVFCLIFVEIIINKRVNLNDKNN